MTKKLNSSADLWLRCVVIIPAIEIVHWALVLIPYAIILAMSAWHLAFKGKNRDQLPIWLLVQAVFLIILAAVYVGDTATFLNISVLFATNLMFTLLFMCVPNTEQSLIYIFIKLRVYLLVLVAFGFVLSVALSGVLGLDNPLRDLLIGERVRLFSKGFGHSVLLDAAVLMLVITLAFFDYTKIQRDLFFVFLSVVFVYLGKAAVGYIGIVAAFFVFAVEHINIGKYYKNLVYFVLVPTFLFVYANYGDDVLLSVRTFQVGSRVVNATYSQTDLSAGRAELNYYLERLIEKSPWVGSGTGNKILQDGVLDNHGHQIARVESALRMGVKYGIFYLALMFSLCIYSALILMSSDVRFRIIGISLALYNLDCFFANGLFETPQTYTYFTLLFPTILVGEYARRSRKPSKRNANQDAYQRAQAQSWATRQAMR